MTFPGSDEDEDRLHHLRYSRSGLSEGHSYGSSTNLYHPRYNTPVSEINNHNNNNNNNEVVVVNIEDGTGATSLMDCANDEEAKADATRLVSRDDRIWPVHGEGEETGGMVLDGGTSLAVDVGRYIDSLKRCQTARTASSSLLNTVSAVALPLDIDAARCALPLKGTFPSYEILPGGRLVRFQFVILVFSPKKFDCRIHHQITRWTQTDNDSVVSRASLDWDNYESERLRTEVDLLDMEHHRLTNAEDEGVEGMTTGLSSTTLLMVSHGSNDTTLQASRISNRSASSPYVLCFECSEDFSVNDERRGGDNSSYFAPRHTSSSPRPPRRTRRSPPTPPAQPNLMDPSPTSRDHLNPDGQQDGRSSKAVKPRRK